MEINQETLEKTLENNYYVKVQGTYGGPLDGYRHIFQLPNRMPMLEIPQYLRDNELDRCGHGTRFYRFRQKTAESPFGGVIKDKERDVSEMHGNYRGYIIHENSLLKLRKVQELREDLKWRELKREQKAIDEKRLINRIIRMFGRK